MKELTAAQITNDTLLKLRAQGHRVRRVNNVGAYKKRAHQVENGWPDIQGYSSQGVAILVEVKKEGDKLSKAQEELLIDCYKCGGFAMVATEIKGETELFNIVEYLLIKNLGHGRKVVAGK